MRSTIYDTKKYILKDLKNKDERIRFVLEEIAGKAHNFDIMKLKEIDRLFCQFYNFLDKF